MNINEPKYHTCGLFSKVSLPPYTPTTSESDCQKCVSTSARHAKHEILMAEVDRVAVLNNAWYKQTYIERKTR